MEEGWFGGRLVRFCRVAVGEGVVVWVWAVMFSLEVLAGLSRLSRLVLCEPSDCEVLWSGEPVVEG